jgi:hypothetical protein
MNGKTIYHLLGKVSVTFSSLEHRIVDLFEYLLTNGEDTLVRPYVLDDIPLSRLIKQTRSLAELRLWEHKSTFAKLKNILDEIDSLRVQRNIFIHGDWFVNELTDTSDSVTVLDFKPKLNKKSGAWEYLNSVLVTKTKLSVLLRKTTSLLDNLTSLDTNIRSLELR